MALSGPTFVGPTCKSRSNNPNRDCKYKYNSSGVQHSQVLLKLITSIAFSQCTRHVFIVVLDLHRSVVTCVCLLISSVYGSLHVLVSVNELTLERPRAHARR